MPGRHTCGVRQDGSVDCWGDDFGGQATPPTGGFASVSVESNHTCGVKRDGSVSCWGIDEQATEAPKGKFTSVSAGYGYNCGTKMDATVACWGTIATAKPHLLRDCSRPSARGIATLVESGQMVRSPAGATRTPPGAQPPSGQFVSVSTGGLAGYDTCGVTIEGSLTCWGPSDFLPVIHNNRDFTGVSTAVWHVCGLKRNGNVYCWALYMGPDTPPVQPLDGEFASISSGEATSVG